MIDLSVQPHIPAVWELVAAIKREEERIYLDANRRRTQGRQMVENCQQNPTCGKPPTKQVVPVSPPMSIKADSSGVGRRAGLALLQPSPSLVTNVDTRGESRE